MQPIRIETPFAVTPDQLDDWGPVKEPIGDARAHIAGREQIATPGGCDRIGIWECSPGRWRRQVMEREFAYFVSGRGRFVPDRGEPIEIRAGDAVWFPAFTRGAWEISETLRKTYVVVGFSAFERSRNAVLRALGRVGMLLATR